MIRIRTLVTICVLQGVCAIVMRCFGLIAHETMTAAIYFPWVTFFGAWILRYPRK